MTHEHKGASLTVKSIGIMFIVKKNKLLNGVRSTLQLFVSQGVCEFNVDFSC